MRVSCVRKEPGGKLLRLSARVEEGRVLELRLDGDFFAHPEEAFEAAEASLAGCPVADFGIAFAEALAGSGVTLLGLSPAFVAESLLEAIAKASGEAP